MTDFIKRMSERHLKLKKILKRELLFVKRRTIFDIKTMREK